MLIFKIRLLLIIGFLNFIYNNQCDRKFIKNKYFQKKNIDILNSLNTAIYYIIIK